MKQVLVLVVVVCALVACNSTLTEPPMDSSNPVLDVWTQIEGNLYRNQYGQEARFPALEPRSALGVSDGSTIEPTKTDEPCRMNPGGLGPIRRLMSDPSLTKAVNWQSATVQLPSPTDLKNVKPGQTVYAYLGGWGNSSTANGGAADAGLQYNADYGTWAMFYNVEGATPKTATFARETGTGADGKPAQFAIHIDPSKPVTMTFWSVDNGVKLRITGTWVRFQVSPVIPNPTKTSLGVMTKDMPIPAAPGKGWTLAGTGQNFKVMTAIAQATPGDLQGDTIFQNVKWSNLLIGKGDATGKAIGTPKSWDASVLDRTKTNFNCVFPPDIVTVATPSASGETVSIRLRVLGILQVDSPNPPLSAISGATATGTIRLSNTGADGSTISYEFTPLGSTQVIRGKLFKDPNSSLTQAVKATCPQQPGSQNLVQTISYTDGTTDPSTGNLVTKALSAQFTLTCVGPKLGVPALSPSPAHAQTKASTTASLTLTNVGAGTSTYNVGRDTTLSWISLVGEDASGSVVGSVLSGTPKSVGINLTCPAEPGTYTTTLDVLDFDNASTGGVALNQPTTVTLVCDGARMEIPFNTQFLYYANAPLEGSFEVRNVGNTALTYQLNYDQDAAHTSTPWLTILSGGSGTVQPNSVATVRFRYQCVVGKDAFGLYDNLTITSNDAVVQTANIAGNSFCKQPNLQAMQLAGNFCPRDANGNLSCPTTGRQNIRQADPSDLQEAYVQVMAISLETGASPNLVSVTAPSGWQFLSSKATTNGKALVYWKWADYFSTTPSAYREWVVNDGRAAPLKGQWAAFWTSAVYGYSVLGGGLADYQIGSVDTSTRRGVPNPIPPVLEVLDPATQPPALPHPVLLPSVGAGSTASCTFTTSFCQLQDFTATSKVGTLAYSSLGQADRTVTSLVTAAAATANYYVVGSSPISSFYNVFSYQRPQPPIALRAASSANRPILGQPSAFPTPRFPPAP